MTKIYIAGPYTNGNTAINVRAAILAGDRLAKAEFTPFIPHLTHFWHLLRPHDWEFWMKQGMQWLETCNCLLRLPGESVGADREVQRARELGLYVYQSVEQALEAMRRSL